MLAQELGRLVALLDAGEHKQDLVGVPHAGRLLVGAREDRHLGRAGQVLDLREQHERLVLHRDVLPRARDDTDDRHQLVLHVLELGEVDDPRHIADALRDVRQWMVGDVDPQQLLLPAEQLLPGRLGTGGRCGDRGLGREVEQADLAGRAVLLLALAGRERGVQPTQLGEARPERVARAGLDERLEHPLVVALQVDAPAEVLEGPERSAGLARTDDVVDRALTDVLDRPEAEADLRTVHDEVEPRHVDVRWHDRDAHPAAFRDRDGHPLRVPHVRGQHGSHVLRRVIRLQVGRVVRDDPINGSVRPVEAVLGERLEVLPHVLDDACRHAGLERAGDELLLLRVELLADLLADRVAEDVGLPQREAGERLRHGHDVLLVDHHAIRRAEHGLERGVRVRDWLVPVLARDVARDVLHRARAEERHHRHDVLDPVRLERLDVAPHPGGLQLE